MSAILSAVGVLAKQAATPVTGYTLINGTGNIISWTAPNDGQLHRVILIAMKSTSVAETGGLISVNFTAPDSSTGTPGTINGGTSPGFQFPQNGTNFAIIKAGTTYTVQQASALTAGASTLWAEIWAS